MFEKIKWALWIFIHPNYWHMLYPYNKAWDKKLNNYLNEGFDLVEQYHLILPSRCKFDKNTFTICVEGSCIWVQNYPYAYGSPVLKDKPSKIRPSRYTIRRLRRYIENHKEINPEYYL